MILGQPLINGVAYAHADIVVNIFGVPLIGITAIEYGDPQDITGNYSTGQHMTSVGFGQVKPFANITMTMELIQTIQNLAPNGKLQNIPFFDIGVNFLPEGGVLIRHSLKKVRFKGRNPNSQVGGSQIEEKLELFVADISYNG
jgi:hypothetical protein